MVEKGYLWRRASDGTELLTSENLGDIPNNCAKDPYYDEDDGRYKFSFFDTSLTNVEMVYGAGGRVDYNKISVTVKSYFLDYSANTGYIASYKGTEKYTTLNVALEDLVAPSLDGETAQYGAYAFVIFGDVSADGKIYNSSEEFDAEISGMTYGTVYFNRDKQITGYNQGTLTCYDMSSEEFTAAALGKTITICTLPSEG